MKIIKSAEMIIEMSNICDCDNGHGTGTVCDAHCWTDN